MRSELNGHEPEPDPRRLGPRSFWLQPGVVAGIASLAIGIGFIVEARTDGVNGRDTFVTLTLAAAGFAGIGGTALAGSLARGTMLAGASGAMVSIGVLSLSSFGLPLVVAGFVAVPGWLRTIEHDADRRTIMIVAAGLVTGFAIVLAGIRATG